MEAYNGLMEFIKDLSVVIGLWVLFYNISAWQREHRGRRNIDLAEGTLALFYEAKDAIAWIRSPLSFVSETDSIKQGERETDEQYQARKRASIVFVRYNQNKELFNKIQSHRYRFMAQIGKDKTKPFDDLDKIVKEIVTSAHLLAILWSERYFRTEEDRLKHSEQIRKAEKTFYSMSFDDDPINPKVDKLIINIEEICKNIIMAKGTLHGFLNMQIRKALTRKKRSV